MSTTTSSQLSWLLEGDPAIRYQTLRDLTQAGKKEILKEQKNISLQGWGHQLLLRQDPQGTWSKSMYSPKWTSTTYTLLLLKTLGIEPCDQTKKACEIILEKGLYHDGGINFSWSFNHSETCVTGMLLSVLSYFDPTDERLPQLADFLLDQQLNDGGWNCRSFNGDTHSSFHTTISALEGLWEFQKNNNYCHAQVKTARDFGMEFLMAHRLFRSHRTGNIVKSNFLKFSFPCRWYYDIMRALDYAQDCGAAKDARFEDAINILTEKQTKDGLWKLQNRHPGKTFFEMEQPGQPSRWNTLRALRILKWWN